ncbi:MAG: hypothetical protein R3B06_27585 [Kofleriaceae bacterium]
MRELSAQARGVTGGWPGTLREAKAHVLAELNRRGATAPTVEQLLAMARTATSAARSLWSTRAEPDPEP